MSKSELTREERWEWLRKSCWTKYIIPWDHMALPSHEWMDEVQTLEHWDTDYNQHEGPILHVPRYREDVDEKMWAFITAVINDRRGMPPDYR